jgi:hypothetical protein
LNRVVLAFFARRTDADTALGALASGGVPPATITWLPKNVSGTSDLGLATASKAPEGAAIGAAVGFFVGALLGAFGGSGSAVLPPLGVVLAGSVVTSLATAGALSAIGLLAGALAGALRPEYEARWMRDAVSSGGSILAVRCEERIDPRRVAALLERCGGVAVRSL